MDEARPSTEEAERAGPEGAEECAGAAEATLGGALAPPSWAAVAGCTGEDCFGAAFTSLLSGDDTLAAEILSGAGRRRGALAAARTDCEARRLSLLHVACMRGAADVAEQLLGLGADPGGRDAAGDTPLHLAIEGAATAPPQSTLRLVAALLAVGADAGARTGEGWPATLLAVLMGAPAAVLHLLAAHGADPNDAEPEEGLTPLHLAARAGDAATVRALLRAGARCNARDVQNRTPLFDALSADSVACAAVLVNLGANLDVIDARGWSPFAHGLRLVARGVGCSKRLLLLLADNGAWDARSTAATLMHQLQVTHFLKEARTRFHEQLASLRSQGLPHETPWAPYVRFAVPPQAQPACPLCKAEFGFFTPRVRPTGLPTAALCSHTLSPPRVTSSTARSVASPCAPAAASCSRSHGRLQRAGARTGATKRKRVGTIGAPSGRQSFNACSRWLCYTPPRSAAAPCAIRSRCRRGCAAQQSRTPVPHHYNHSAGAHTHARRLPSQPGLAEGSQEGEAHLVGQRGYCVGAVAVCALHFQRVEPHAARALQVALRRARQG